MPEPGEPITYTFRFELAVSPNTPPPGLAVQLCALLDVDCQAPVPGLPAPDASGTLVFEADAAFEGFLQISADDLVPSLAFLPAPIVLPPTEKVIRVVRTPEFNAIIASTGQTYDPTRGVAIVLTSDCQDARAAGVVLESANADAASVPYYFKGQIPDLMATETDMQGAGGWLNLPAELVTVTARRAGTGEFIGVVGFRSRAGTISYAPIGPTAGM
jgi:hypothetical protein